jgi:hypothetical protein
MPGRLTWTLCHELGHIVLDHFNKYDMANLVPWEEKILNREADIFVRELLMPENWDFIEVNYCTSMKLRRAIAMTVLFKTPRNDAKMRFLECPVCGNNSFSYDASFCKICGLYLFNDCLRSPYDPRTNYGDECGRANVANALYCEHCGAKTMLCEHMESQGYDVGKTRPQSGQSRRKMRRKFNFK